MTARRTNRRALGCSLVALLALGSLGACSPGLTAGADGGAGETQSGGKSSAGGRSSGGGLSSGGAETGVGGNEQASGGSDSGGSNSGGTSSGGASPGDECALGTDNCDKNATCKDTRASFVCTCNSGFTGSGTEGQCEDINECQTGDHNCDTKAKCSNNTGSFSCACKPGYSGNGTVGQCTNIDECQTGDHNCDTKADCSDTEGSFSCACKPGYSGGGTVGQCEDINECQVRTDNCDSHATCMNNSGSFGCMCNKPYYGDGVSCTCRQKSSTNVIVQGGLDTSASVGQQTTSNLGAVWSNDNGGTWVSNQDAEGCADSGALQIVNTRDKIYATSTICVPVTGNRSYYLGLKYKRTKGAKFACQPIYYSEPGCVSGIGYGAPTISIDRATSDDANWISVASSVGTSAAGAQSAILFCRSELASNDEMSATWVWIDQVFFNSSSADF